MSQKLQKNLFKNTIIVIIISCILNTIIWIGFHGVPLFAIPKIEEVQSITLCYNNIEQKEIINKKEIELLIKASNLLNYKIGGKGEGQAIFSIIYHLKNGNDVIIQANNTTVWYNEKTYEIKEKNMFVDIIKGLFFDLEI